MFSICCTSFFAFPLPPKHLHTNFNWFANTLVNLSFCFHSVHARFFCFSIQTHLQILFISQKSMWKQHFSDIPISLSTFCFYVKHISFTIFSPAYWYLCTFTPPPQSCQPPKWNNMSNISQTHFRLFYTFKKLFWIQSYIPQMQKSFFQKFKFPFLRKNHM